MARRSALVAFVALAATFPALACGGLVVPDGDAPGPRPSVSVVATAPSGSAAPSVGTGSAGVPSVPPSSPAPTCDPAKCELPHVTAHACREGICVPVVCEAGFQDCDGDIWNGCEAAVVERYADEDGDGHGALTATTSCPKAGVAYVESHDDCDDTNALVRPGQTAYFTQPRGDGSFDYDCSGADEPRESRVYRGTCLCSDFGCSLGEGWFVEAPACGAMGTWARAPGGFSCEPLREQRGQACR